MSITGSMTPEQWEARKAEDRRRLSTIVIPLDITPGVAKGLLSRIDAFYSEVCLELGELEAQRENLDSRIEEWERTKIAGTNDMVRKKTASEAIQAYPVGNGETVNLYELYRNINERYSWIKSVIKALEGKQSRLITVGGLLKLEKELAPHASLE